MLADLIAIGVFADSHYDTPASRTLPLRLARAILPLPDKYDQELLDYRLDWSVRLDGDTIQAVRVETISGETSPSRAIFDDHSVSFWLGGGRSGNGSAIRCVVTTEGGRLLEQILSVRCL